MINNNNNKQDLFVKPCHSSAPNASYGATNSGLLRCVEFNAIDLSRARGKSRNIYMLRCCIFALFRNLTSFFVLCGVGVICFCLYFFLRVCIDARTQRLKSFAAYSAIVFGVL